MASLKGRVAGATLQDILEIENDPEILSFRCPATGWIAWPTVRHVFLSYLMNELAYKWPALIGPLPTLWQQRAAAAALATCMTHNIVASRRGIARRPIMIIASTGTMVPWDGQSLNRISDHFALATMQQAWSYEDVSAPRFDVPCNRVNPDVIYTLPSIGRRYLYSAVGKRAQFRRVAAALTAFLRSGAKRLFGLQVPPERCAWVHRFIETGIARNSFERNRYRSIFERGRPRILLVTAGTGGALAPAILTARSMGIPVAEYQHGQSGSGQPAYNFAPAVRDSAEYRATLPDFFLAWGEWWVRDISVPMQHVIIGYPHRSEALARAKPAAVQKDGILVVAKLGDAERYLALARDLRRSSGDRYNVTLRPNPRDRGGLKLNSAGERTDDIDVDFNPDFYISLARADIVVSGPSSTLAEAIGAARRILIWEEAGASFKDPGHMFEHFTTAAELIDMLNSNATVRPDRPAADEIWAPDWRDRYQRFIAPFLT